MPQLTYNVNLTGPEGYLAEIEKLENKAVLHFSNNEITFSKTFIKFHRHGITDKNVVLSMKSTSIKVCSCFSVWWDIIYIPKIW